MEGAPVALGGPRGFAVTRTLPNRQRRMVGAWCFLDAYGPHDLADADGMRVGPHPHTGLQTVTWLVGGEVLHRDSLGNRQEIRPGQLNLMTAGRGISHSEETPRSHSRVLHGVQLWVALPHAQRDMPPAFAHHADLPVVAEAGLSATVLMGTLAGATSPATTHTPLVGAEIRLTAEATLPINPDFEYAALALDGAATVDGATLKPGPLLYLGAGRDTLRLGTDAPARLLLLGGEPFEERLVMWWNFVARDHDEIVAMRADWADATPRFGSVHGYDGPPLPAPPMPITRLVPRGRVR
nr:pirin family protein [Actinoplanes rishiriensis]